MKIRRTIAIAALLVSFLPLFGQGFLIQTFPCVATDNALGSKFTDAGFLSENNIGNPGNPLNTHVPEVWGMLTTSGPLAMNGTTPGNPVNIDTIVSKDSITGNFEIGEFIRMDDQENLLIYFNCMGRIAEKRCAEFYRKGKMDSTNLSLAGPVKDYYTNDTLAFEAYIENSLLNGHATFYHRNGMIHAKGRYRENMKTGVWTYFYDNGKPEKIINFVRGYPFIVAYHQRNGKQSVVQGNGKFREKIFLEGGCSPYEISGRVVEGKLHGKWKIYAGFNHQKVAAEYYENGKFIKRKSQGEIFTGQPMIRIHDFCPNEALLWTENISGCGSGSFQALKYKGQGLHAQFYAEIIDSLNTLAADTLPEQWLIAGIQMARTSIVHSVQIKSSVQDRETEENIRRILKSMIYFSISGQDENETEANFLFTILLRDNGVIIPADLYYREWIQSLAGFTGSDDDW